MEKKLMQVITACLCQNVLKDAAREAKTHLCVEKNWRANLGACTGVLKNKKEIEYCCCNMVVETRSHPHVFSLELKNYRVAPYSMLYSVWWWLRIPVMMRSSLIENSATSAS